jgi:hypothetical protein
VVARDDVDLQIFVGKKEVTVTREKTASAFDEHPRKYHEAESRGALPLPLLIIYVGLAGSLSALWCLDGCLVCEPSQTQGCSTTTKESLLQTSLWL